MVDKWIEAIQALTGFKYIPNDEVEKEIGVKNDNCGKKL